MADTIPLGADLTPGVDELGNQEKALSRKEAKGILYELFRRTLSPDTRPEGGGLFAGMEAWVGGSDADRDANGQAYDKIVDIIVARLPDEALYYTVLDRIDYRPLLEKVRDENEIESFAGGDVTAQLFNALDKQAKESAQILAPPNVTGGDRISWIANATKYDAGTLAVSPQFQAQEQIAANLAGSATPQQQQQTPTSAPTTADPLDPAAPAGPATATPTAPAPTTPAGAAAVNTYGDDAWDPLAGTEELVDGPATSVNTRQFYTEQMRVLFQNTGGGGAKEESFDELIDIEERWQSDFKEAGLDPTLGSFEMRLTTPTNTGSRASTRSVPLSAADALNYLFDQTDADIRKLEKNLQAAGFYDELGIAPTFTGDPFEEANTKAWKALLREAALKGIPVDQALREHEQSFTDRQEVIGGTPLFDDKGRLLRDSEGREVRYLPDGTAELVDPELEEEEPEVTEISDPTEIVWDADYRAGQLLNRYLDGNEKQYIISAVHDAERSWTRRAREVASAGGEIEEFSADTVINSFVKALMPIDNGDDTHPLTADELRFKFMPNAQAAPDSKPNMVAANAAPPPMRNPRVQ